jgi:hypothetical protein
MKRGGVIANAVKEYETLVVTRNVIKNLCIDTAGRASKLFYHTSNSPRGGVVEDLEMSRSKP